MSGNELGNTLRSLRGAKSQKAVAEAVGINTRTLIRAESGKGASLETVRKLSQYYKLRQPEHAALIVAYLRYELGDDFNLLVIRSRTGKAAPVTQADKFIEQFRNVPANLQRELTRALKHNEVLSSIAHLNDLAEKLSKQPDSD